MNNFAIIGNSHLSQFDNPHMKTIYGYGASILGLWNENSVLQLKKHILDYQKNNKNDILVFFLGQTDIEFIYYFKSVKQNKKIDINEYIHDLVDKYISFIKTFITNKVVILGINPHVIKDIQHTYNVNFTEKTPQNPNGDNSSDKYKFSDYLHIYNDSYETRCSYNMLFNKMLEEKCKHNNVNYITDNDIILDDNGNVKEKYFPRLVDHHLVKNIDLYNHLVEKLKTVQFP